MQDTRTGARHRGARIAGALVAGALGLAACSGEPAAPPAPAAGDAQAAQPAAAPAAPAATPNQPASPPDAAPAADRPLPDLTADLVTGACENGPGKEGADSHFLGTFQLRGDTVTGEERWILHANQHWKARGGNDCSISWRVTGSKIAPGACGDCDFGLMLSGDPDVTGSDCPEDLVKKEARHQELRYDVKLQSDGTAFIYFAKSGRRLGQGYHNGQAITWISPHQCKWF